MALARSHRFDGLRAGRLMVGLIGLTTLALAGPAKAQDAVTSDDGARLTFPLSLAWRYTANYDGNNPSAPVVAGNSIYFAAGDRFYALDVATGAIKWRYPEDQPLDTRIRTNPIVTDTKVYFGTEAGKLYALNTEDGKGTWLFDTKSSVGSSPVFVDGIVYFGSSDGRVWAIDTATGNQVPTWAKGVKMGDEITGTPVVANDTVFVISMDQVLHAIGRASGNERAQTRLGGTVVRQAPAALNGDVFAVGGTNLGCFLGRSLTRRWTQILPADAAVAPVVSDQGCFVITAENKIYAFDPRTGRPRWKAPATVEYDVIARPTLVGTSLIVGTVEGGVYAFDTATGAQKWFYMTQPSSRRDDAILQFTNVAASPVAVGSSLYVLSDDGTLSAFRPGALDSVGPLVTDLEPEMGSLINGAPPIHFEAKINDVASGINPASIRLLIDGEGVIRRPEGKDNYDKPGFHYDPLTTILQYDSPEPQGASTVQPISDGRHTVSVVVSDWAGNTTTRSWVINIDNSVAKISRRKGTTGTGRGTGPGGMGRGGGLGSGGGTGPGGMGGRGGGMGGRGGGLGGGRGGRRGGGGGGGMG